MNIFVTMGSITAIETDAILCPIEPGGFWFSATHNAIRACAENLFHQQIPHCTMTQHGSTYLATSESEHGHTGHFRHILFVVDEGEPHSIATLVYHALQRAANEGIHSISIPMIRSETTIRRGTSTVTNTEISEMVDGVTRFREEMHLSLPITATRPSQRNSLRCIQFIAADNHPAFTALTTACAHAFASP